MGEAKGMLLTCDRCGATCFLRTVGDGVTDGDSVYWEISKDWYYKLGAEPFWLW